MRQASDTDAYRFHRVWPTPREVVIRSLGRRPIWQHQHNFSSPITTPERTSGRGWGNPEIKHRYYPTQGPQNGKKNIGLYTGFLSREDMGKVCLHQDGFRIMPISFNTIQ